jgi:deoxyribodipyrimidine photo-lyase
MQTTLVLFRQDLRLGDNPALQAAAERGAVVLAYVLDEETPGRWRLGAASRWWLHHSLAALAEDIVRHGNQLILRRGATPAEVLQLVEQSKAKAVFWNHGSEPFARDSEAELQAALRGRSVEVGAFNAGLLFEPGSIVTKGGTPFSVFTPFWRACLQAPAPAAPIAAPKKLRAPAKLPKGDALAAWQLLPTKPDWSGGLRQSWTPGEAAARKRLSQFIDGSLARYKEGHDRPAMATASRLSPHLHFGEIGPRQVWHAVQAASHHSAGLSQNAGKFLSELGWRDFSYNLLHAHPSLPDRNLRQDFDGFPWRRDAAALKAWQQGRTGYPIVDAGMRQLWRTGWMHNRVRMIAASFLIKHLLIDWRQGERWFWDTLVDADLANNAFNWQWVAGSGADASPYFRIFNPVLQGEKFDTKGEYVKHWVPELKRLDAKFVHAPWRADANTLEAAGIVLGKTYPKPLVDHDTARRRALGAFTQMRERAA